MRTRGWCRAWWCRAFLALLALTNPCSCKEGHLQAASGLVLGGLAVQHVQPTRVTQYRRTQLTVVLNGSLCGELGQVPAGELQLVLQGAAAGGRNITFNSSHSSSNCTSWEFTVQPNSTAQRGSFAAHLVLPKQRVSLRLPQLIAVDVPLLLSMRTSVVNVTADTSAFAVRVQLNAAAGPGGVTVRLQLMTDAGAVRVFRDSVSWAAGASGTQAFWLALKSSPSSGQLLVQLQQPQGAVLDSDAMSTVVDVQSPVVGFKTDLGYYRGVNTSRPSLQLTVAGTSAFASQFAYRTYLLPGSRPSAVPCHPLASSCSVASLEAVENSTLTGMRWLAPGQQQLDPIELPITWSRLPPETELRVAVRILPKFNTRVAPQAGQVAAVVFGTPPGRCPPGSAVLSGHAVSRNSSSHDEPVYTNVAALQELALALFPEPDHSSNRTNSSGSSSTFNSGNSSTDAAAPAGSISRNLLLKDGSSSSSSSTVPCNTSIKANCSNPGAADEAAAASTVIDMDPPFRPMVDRYIALLPPKPSGAGKLLLASSRRGDVVVVDAAACNELKSARFQVGWLRNERMWRQRYPLVGQRNPCWLRVHVFTRNDVDVGAAGHADKVDASSSGNGPRDTNRSSSSRSDEHSTRSSMWDLPDDFVLYRSYTIRFIPLRPPQQLSLRAITFSNSGTTVIACGVPRPLSHLFESAPPAHLSNVMSSGMVSSTGNSSSSVTGSGDRSRSALAGGFAPAAAAVAAASLGSGAGGSSSAAQDGGQYSPRPLVPVAGQVVQVAYLVLQESVAAAAAAAHGPGIDSSTGAPLQQQQQQQRTAAAPVASVAAAGSRSRQEQYSLHDPLSNKTIVWSRFTTADCTQDHYILLPLAQMRPDMKMVAELLDAEAEGVNISMSEAALALSGGAGLAGSANSSSNVSSAANGNSSVQAAGLVDGAEGSSGGAPGLPGAAAVKAGVNGDAAAAVDGGRGYGGFGNLNLGVGVWCSSSGSRSTPAGTAGSVLGGSRMAGLRGGGNHSSSQGSSRNGTVPVANKTASSSTEGSDGCGLQLPGVTAELPIILTADEGMSSRTYTLLLYSNESAAAAVRRLVLPQEAAAAAAAAKTVAAAGASSSSTPDGDAARLSAAYFADRPRQWPRSPAQDSKCTVCPNGTYSTRIDADECKVCPPGKYAASPFSTSCLFCPPGSFSYYWGAPACRTCLPGTFAADAGSLFCNICRDGTTTSSEGATSCDVSFKDGGSIVDSQGASEYAIMLKFGVVLDGTMLEAVTRSTTGINGSSEGIVAVLVASDTATALNVSLGRVQVLAVQQISNRQLLVNVTATVPVDAAAEAAAAAMQDLSADELIQRLVDDPNTFLRTTQTLGAESASVQDIITQRTRRARLGLHGKLHAVLWPTLLGSLLLLSALLCLCWRWRRAVRRSSRQFLVHGGASHSPHQHQHHITHLRDCLHAASLAGGSSVAAAHGSPCSQRSYAMRPLRGLSSSGSSSDDASTGSGSDAGGGHAAAGLAGMLGLSRGGWVRRGWQRLWSSRIQVVLHSGSSSSSDGGRAGFHAFAPAGDGGAGGSRSVSGSGDCSPGSGRMSARGEELCVTVAVGGCPLSEESFTARLRAKQLGSAAGMLYSGGQYPPPTGGVW